MEKSRIPLGSPCGSPHGSPCLDHCTAPTSTRLDASSEDAAAVRSSSPPARLPLPHVGCYIHTARLCFHSMTLIQAEKVPTTRARKKAGVKICSCFTCEPGSSVGAGPSRGLTPKSSPCVTASCLNSSAASLSLLSQPVAADCHLLEAVCPSPGEVVVEVGDRPACPSGKGAPPAAARWSCPVMGGPR